MWLETYEEFRDAARRLYDASPLKARYSVKYRHSDGLLTVKMTDDVTVLKYKTDQVQDLKRLEKLNNVLFTLMALGELPPEEQEAEAAAAASSDASGKQAQAPAKKKGRRQ